MGLDEGLKHAFVKKGGYLSRLFSEPLSEWVENETALGRVVSLFKDYCERPSQALLKRAAPYMAQAKREAKELMKGSCALSIAGGVLGSAATHNPLPLVLGLSGCFKFADAAPTVNNPIPDYQTQWLSVNYQFASDTFYDPKYSELFYSAVLANGNASLPEDLEFDPSTRTFTGFVDKTSRIRVFAKNQENEEAYSDFDIKYDVNSYLSLIIFLSLGIFCCCGILANQQRHSSSTSGERKSINNAENGYGSL